MQNTKTEKNTLATLKELATYTGKATSLITLLIESSGNV